ncbi:hypothetical protein GCG21_01910 [Pseudactinotalea sp. HY160]|uniref:putative acetyltransferase n=1 Tax=Pseudactinotalea sp. HY160 TaxID=2654490 RepID=UPI00128AFDC6|nr:hypothetical protein [Pseudactinotalea sp. HY160]MPV48786.1 hypothetical protein [Pseudactinotalea sp. HY160]
MGNTGWATWPVGSRVVVRYRIPGGVTDALGVVLRVDASGVEIATKRGPVAVPGELITHAKLVPPAPVRRPRHPDPTEPGGPA